MCLSLLSVFLCLSIRIRLANVCEIYLALSHRSFDNRGEIQVYGSNYAQYTNHFPKAIFIR